MSAAPSEVPIRQRPRQRRRPAQLAVLVLLLAGCRTPVPEPSGPQTTEAPAVETLRYGDHADQVGDLQLPDGDPPAAGWPVVVLVHGGFWRERYRRDLMEPLAADVVPRGYASWNVEYRRVGGAGGWPTTLTDLAAAIDRLATVDAPLDLDRVAVAGHSAGGHLALWAAGREQLPADAPGAGPVVRPCLAVGQAAVADLAAAQTLGDRAVRDLLGGGPDEVPQRYAQADPVRLVGHGVPVLLVHGEVDATVPVDQSRRYLAAARRAGDEVELVVRPGDHFVVLDPEDATWQAVLDALETSC